MKYYLQTDPEYCNEELVPGVTIKKYGCFFCCICTLAQIHPLELLKLCKESEYCFTENGLLYSGKVGSLAGIPYVGKFIKNNKKIGVVQISRWDNGFSHFVVQYNTGRYFDPLNGFINDDELDNIYKDYNYSSFRIFDNVKKDWIEETRREGMELGLTNGERMTEPMIRAEGVKLALNLYNLLKK